MTQSKRDRRRVDRLYERYLDVQREKGPGASSQAAYDRYQKAYDTADRRAEFLAGRLVPTRPMNSAYPDARIQYVTPAAGGGNMVVVGHAHSHGKASHHIGVCGPECRHGTYQHAHRTNRSERRSL